jgi:hypothetical protein
MAEVGSLRARLRSQTALPPGMVDAIAAASLVRPSSEPALFQHYTQAMPAMMRQQRLEPLFATRLEPVRLPRLLRGLEALFSLVADAGAQCEVALGAATPAALLRLRPTLGALYAGCHFGASMPMLYAAPGDLSALGERAPIEFIDARLASPLVHELSHLHASDPDLLPAPANLHEALAAFIGSEAFPDQIDGADALPGAAHFAAVGGWLARGLGLAAAVRAQAGLLDLREALGPACAEAVRLYGWSHFLDTGAPHLLADAFAPGRWWKLIDLHRDPPLARELSGRLAAPMLRGEAVPKAAWDAWLDGLPWQDLPAFRDSACALDDSLARRARTALHVRAERQGLTFRAVRRELPGPLVLDRDRCEVSAPWPGPDAVGAPACQPYPPPLCRT